jgi:predicted transposase YbfD/YdcC
VRRAHAFGVDALNLDFPFARTLLVVRSERTIKKSGHTTSESRYYLSSAEPSDYSAQKWLALTRGHWAGVENRNHWRRDALMGEDRSRTRHASALANLALLRNTLLRVLADAFPETPLPEIQQNLATHPARSHRLLTTP